MSDIPCKCCATAIRHDSAMKYYVRKDASCEIEGPFELEAIRGWIAGGRFAMEHEGVLERIRKIDR